MKQIINPAGGIYYHINALRYKKMLWQPFINNLNLFLQDWPTTKEHLVIFGGSAGYCLTQPFLDRFNKITLVDPDPLAAKIFSYRFNKKISKSHKNYLDKDFIKIQQLKDDFTDAAILFSNILGQFPYLLNPQEEYKTTLKNSLFKIFKDREWASFHDLLSYHFKKTNCSICWPLILQAQNNEESIDKLQQQLQLRPSKVHVVDHLTEGIFNNSALAQKLYWQRTPHSYHIIEAVAHSC
ncbi:MAG: hypothetical protein KDD40_02225 [Bdellovibrionales bacterium]|nr:hypothetical protein [Bdellovibrionales bacterium]